MEMGDDNERLSKYKTTRAIGDRICYAVGMSWQIPTCRNASRVAPKRKTLAEHGEERGASANGELAEGIAEDGLILQRLLNPASLMLASGGKDKQRFGAEPALRKERNSKAASSENARS